MIKDFKRIISQQSEVNQLQSRLQEFFQPLVENPLLDGALLTGVELVAGENKIPHKLQRPALGYIVVDKNAQADVWTSSKELSKAFITLQSNAPVTVSLWVF